ncbi:glucose-6-phosphate dehydrogenase, partial [Modestobacter sp. VKM Ac-2676]
MPEDVRDRLVDRLAYQQGDVTVADDLRRALDRATGRPVVYLALPNTVFLPTLQALTEVELPEGTSIGVEKPFGRDQADARELNTVLHRLVPEDRIFRTDHFLAKQTVLNILGLRFANRVFEPVWNAGHVERVEIVFDETLGLEGRAGYYDTAGALRDMLQNHLLQQLAFIA